MNTKYGDDPTTRYTEASPYRDQPAHVCITNAAGKETTALTVRTTSMAATEDDATALAITRGTDAITSLMNYQAARHNYQRGRISKMTFTSLSTFL